MLPRLILIAKKNMIEIFKNNCNFNDVPDLDMQLYIKCASSAVTMIEIQYRFILSSIIKGLIHF